MEKINIPELIMSILKVVLAGLLSGIVTSGSMNVYQNIAKPPLAPPGFIFPIVWTILYTLMGISLYLVRRNGNESRKAVILFKVQLFVNLIWPIFFFNDQNYKLAFFILILLWILVLFMIIEFFKINKTSAYLMYPYLLWLTFAGYLNFYIAYLA